MADYISQSVLKSGAWTHACDSCLLFYEDRFLRRKVLKTAKGASLLVDLAQTHLGATVMQIEAPFTPERGAYGHGRTHSHDHGATAYDYDRDHDH